MDMSKISNAEQLRRAIDSGKTKDKVDVFDPAAAPLGADEEAAGTPTPPAAFHREHAQRRAAAATVKGGRQQGDGGFDVEGPPINWRLPAVVLVIAVAVMAAVAMLH